MATRFEEYKVTYYHTANKKRKPDQLDGRCRITTNANSSQTFVLFNDENHQVQKYIPKTGIEVNIMDCLNCGDYVDIGSYKVLFESKISLTQSIPKLPDNVFDEKGDYNNKSNHIKPRTMPMTSNSNSIRNEFDENTVNYISNNSHVRPSSMPMTSNSNSIISRPFKAPRSISSLQNTDRQYSTVRLPLDEIKSMSASMDKTGASSHCENDSSINMSPDRNNRMKSKNGVKTLTAVHPININDKQPLIDSMLLKRMRPHQIEAAQWILVKLKELPTKIRSSDEYPTKVCSRNDMKSNSILKMNNSDSPTFFGELASFKCLYSSSDDDVSNSSNEYEDDELSESGIISTKFISTSKKAKGASVVRDKNENVTGVILADEMGLGKTLTAITVIW